MARHPSEDTDGIKEGFLERWSRRKREARDDGGGLPQAPSDRKSGTEGAEDPAAGAPEPPPKTDADMPSIETIGESTDVSDFFSPEVSEGLRRAALRRLFHLPKFNVVDGLNDYDEDFRNFAPLGDIITADMRHRLELAKERAKAALQETEGGSELKSESGADQQTEGAQDEAEQVSDGRRNPQPVDEQHASGDTDDLPAADEQAGTIDDKLEQT